LRENPTSTETIARWRWLLSEDPSRAIRILRLLSQSGSFDSATWSLALDYLNREDTRSECVVLFGTFGSQLGTDFVSKHLHQLSSLIEAYARAKGGKNDDAFWLLWDLLLRPSEEYEFNEGSDPAFAALNSSIGYLTESLLKKLGELNPTVYENIPGAVRRRLENLLTGVKSGHGLSRLLLAKALPWLYRMNAELTSTSLLDRMNWDRSPEAKLIWVGYLWAARITPELWTAIRPSFLATFPRSSELGHAETQFYALFAFLLLHEEFVIDAADGRRALANASPKGRSHVAWYWWRQTDSATDYGATIFRERLRYLLTDIWPIEVDLREQDSSLSLALLASCCGTAFPDAVETISPLLMRVDDPQMFISTFKDKGHAENYPEASLALIDAVVGQQISAWNWQDFAAILAQISIARPGLTTDARFLRLRELVRLHE